MTTPLPRRPGLIIPSSNTIMEADFVRYAPPGVSVHTARMFLEDTTPEAESRMLDEFTLPAAHDLVTTRPDVVVFGCTSGQSRSGEGLAGHCHTDRGQKLHFMAAELHHTFARREPSQRGRRYRSARLQRAGSKGLFQYRTKPLCCQVVSRDRFKIFQTPVPGGRDTGWCAGP